MTSIRMALTELRRLTAGRLPVIALCALALVPTLYGGLYLYANHDPYGNLDHVPAALVVADSGSRVDGKALNVGRDVGNRLLDQGDFDWSKVDEAQAREGVRRGDYDFALIVPADFSRALTSPVRFDPRQAQLRMLTNDANSYLSTTIANTVVGKVKDAISQEVGREAATQFLTGLGSIRTSLQGAVTGAEKLAAGAKQARAGSGRLKDGAAQLADGAGTLSSGLGTLQDKTSSLPDDTRRLADGSRQVADGNAKIAGIGDRVGAASTKVRDAYAARRDTLQQRMQDLGLTPEQQQSLLTVYDDLGTPVRNADQTVQQARRDLDRLASGADQVADGNATLASGIPALVAAITQARDGAGRLSTGADQLSTGATQLDGGLGRLASGSTELTDGLRDGVEQIPAIDDATRDRIAETLGDPVAIAQTSQAKAATYGAGLAPFFMALAAWIGGYVLFLLVRPLSNRAMAANQTPLRVAVGGWLAPALIGAVQMTLLLGVVLLAVGITPVNVAGTLTFLLLASACFIAIVHSLNAWLGTAGQFLGLVMMVLQLITSGGTFPWQTIPTPLYPLHHVLPMSYAVDGLRQLMYGGLDSRVLTDVLVLVAWLVAAVLATSVAARRQRVWGMRRVKPQLTV